MIKKNLFMLRAIELSIESAKSKGGPFGSVIVKKNLWQKPLSFP